MESIPENDTAVLVVDDDEGLLLSIRATLLSAGMAEPALVSDSRRVMPLLQHQEFQVVLLDLIMPHIDGLDLLQKIKSEFPHMQCIVVTAVDQATTAVQAMSCGAYDYLVKPLNSDKLIITINRALEHYSLKHELSLLRRRQTFDDLKHPEAFADFVAEDESMARVFHQVESVAPTDYSVIIQGESGTGKEMVARAIHGLSKRAEGPFLAVNMAAVSKTIFEDEFFGHTKGAYTDAASDKPGFFEAAHEGTLFLDEVTELEPALQGKLLRVIEERELYRLGSTQVRNVNVRIVAATNRDIQEEIRRNRFRADLYHRLNMYSIEVPPLRHRKDDILPLARHFACLHAGRNGKRIEAFSPRLKDCLLQYPFSGNVRELEHLMAAAVLRETRTELGVDSSPELTAVAENQSTENTALMTLEEVEKRHILQVLKATGGNKIQAAKILGVNPSTIYRKIEKYRLSRLLPSSYN